MLAYEKRIGSEEASVVPSIGNDKVIFAAYFLSFTYPFISKKFQIKKHTPSTNREMTRLWTFMLPDSPFLIGK